MHLSRAIGFWLESGEERALEELECSLHLKQDALARLVLVNRRVLPREQEAAEVVVQHHRVVVASDLAWLASCSRVGCYWRGVSRRVSGVKLGVARGQRGLAVSVSD